MRAITASSPHPRVIFAIRPQFGHRSADWICPDHRGEGFIEPVWYRCLLPPIEVDTLPSQRLGAPLGPWDPGSHIIWQRFLDRNYFGSISFVLNEHGEEIREARVVDDPYLRTDGLPNPDIFFVTDLPPLRSDAVIP